MATIIYGKNPVAAAVEAGHVKVLYIAARLKEDRFAKEIASSVSNVKYQSDAQIEQLAKTNNTQGYAAEVEDYASYSLADLIAAGKGKKFPLLVMLDGIEDPHNLGAILRSADAFGVDGIIVKSRGEAPLNATVAKVSTGAIEFVKIAEVTNLNQAIDTLKKAGYWIVSTDGYSSVDYGDIDYKCPICVVIGSEGFGISKLVLKNSDFVVRIPMYGHVNSLNASNAAAILLAGIDYKRRH